ncbi:MAG: hypothetical protein ABI811_17305 [Acidobacteriota bacterium]
MRVACLALLLASHIWAQQPADYRAEFQVRYVATGSVYLAGGRDEGLREGFHLAVKHRVPGEPALSAKEVARLVVVAVAAHSAVCEVESSTGEIQTGDVAEVAREDLQVIQSIKQSTTARRYAQVVTFTEGDPLEQEQRDYVPKPRPSEVNRSSGRISLENNTIYDRQSRMGTYQQGVVFRADVARIGGSYWNLTGYWRGRFNSQSGPQVATRNLRDVLNRTYHLGLFYNNPQSKYTIGVGRLFVPWASSLNTIDGGYIARRLGRYWTGGAFGGSTPDPTAWDYKPGRQIGGVFLNAVAGDFSGHRYTSTVGLAITRLHWKAEREFAFAENTYTWKTRLSVFHNLQADRLTPGRLGNTKSGASVSRSFLTVRLQPTSWLTFDVSHNYLRNVPTFDAILLSTGLLDQYLFTGFSGGLRVDLPRGIAVYGSLGESKRSGDGRGSLNQTLGVTFRDFYNTKIRADFRHSVFSSAFGRGWYQLVSFSRQFSDQLRLDVQGGAQAFSSPVTQDNRGFWTSTTLDWFLGRHYVLNSGATMYRGELQNYDQVFFSLGYRY